MKSFVQSKQVILFFKTLKYRYFYRSIPFNLSDQTKRHLRLKMPSFLVYLTTAACHKSFSASSSSVSIYELATCVKTFKIQTAN